MFWRTLPTDRAKRDRTKPVLMMMNGSSLFPRFRNAPPNGADDGDVHLGVGRPLHVSPRPFSCISNERLEHAGRLYWWHLKYFFVRSSFRNARTIVRE